MMHEIACDTNGFLQSIITYADLACVYSLQQILQELSNFTAKETGQLQSYDTNFQLGDFYASALLLRHIIFEENPFIPLMFYYIRKTQVH